MSFREVSQGTLPDDIQTRQDLVIQNKQLSDLNAELLELTSVIGHDFQSLLTAVETTSAELIDGWMDTPVEDAIEDLTLVRSSARRMQVLARALLQYATLVRRRTPLELVDCEHILDRALAQLAQEIRSTGAIVTHDSLPAVVADSECIHDLFAELIRNALKHRKADVAPRVHISAVCSRSGCRFSVQDNGSGFDMADARRVFNMFVRLKDQRDCESLGVGLALCRRVVVRHGGRIWVESESGQGSTFFFTIPDTPGAPRR
jgi:light-regulated signal transduction histidine kinase (bacteriophytochrome)